MAADGEKGDGLLDDLVEFVTAALVLALVMLLSGIAAKFRNLELQVLLMALGFSFFSIGLAPTYALEQLL